MRTIDTNPKHGLALVEDVDGTNTRYVALADAPPIDVAELNTRPTHSRQVYLKQHHYVAAHTIVGLQVHDRIDESGSKPPRDGWTRWSAL